MDIEYDSQLKLLFIEIGKRTVTNENVKIDLEKMREILQVLNNNQQTLKMIVNIETIPVSSAIQLPQILGTVIAFSGENQELIETTIEKTFLVSTNRIGRTFIDLLLQRRKSHVPVVVCSSLDEAVEKLNIV